MILNYDMASLIDSSLSAKLSGNRFPGDFIFYLFIFVRVSPENNNFSVFKMSSYWLGSMFQNFLFSSFFEFLLVQHHGQLKCNKRSKELIELKNVTVSGSCMCFISFHMSLSLQLPFSVCVIVNMCVSNTSLHQRITAQFISTTIKNLLLRSNIAQCYIYIL